MPARLGRRLVRALDERLRRRQGIYAFSEDPRCIYRFSVTRSKVRMALSDGTTVAPGDALGIIHFWNERLPAVPPEGPDVRWGRAMYRSARDSLHLLAQHVAGQPELATVRAVGSDLAGFLTGAQLDVGAGVFERLGFEVRRSRPPSSIGGRFARFWENVYSLALVWTYNPGTVRGKNPLTLERFAVWMPRSALEGRYLRAAGADSDETEAPAAEAALVGAGERAR